MESTEKLLASSTNIRLRRSYEAEDVNRLQPASYEKFLGELHKKTVNLKMADKGKAAAQTKKDVVVNSSQGAIRKSYMTGRAMSVKESHNGKRTNALQRIHSVSTRRLQSGVVQTRTLPTNSTESRLKRPEAPVSNSQFSISIISRKTSAGCQKPIALRRGRSGENFMAGAEVATRSCVSSPGGSNHDSNCMDSGSPTSNCGCDCENTKRLLRLLSEHEKLQMEHARVLREYQPTSSEAAISAISDNQPSEVADCYKKEVMRLKDELLAVKRQREEDLKCYDMKEVDLEQQIVQLIQLEKNKDDDLVYTNKKLADIMEQDRERKERCEFLEEEVCTLKESLTEAEEQIKKIQQAYFASEEQCITLKNVTVRLTKLNGAVGNVARDTSTAILRANKRLNHLISHFRIYVNTDGDLVTDPTAACDEVSDSKLGNSDVEDELYDGDLNMTDFPIVSQLKELEDCVMQISNLLRRVLEERLENELVTKNERLATWSVLKALHRMGLNKIQNGVAGQEKLSNGNPVENENCEEELCNWALGYFAKTKDNLDTGCLKSLVPKNNCDTFILESDHLAEILSQQAEICKLKAELDSKNSCLDATLSKYTCHKEILSANCKGAEAEIKQLDLMLDSVLEVLLGIPTVVETSGELQTLWKSLTDENYPNRKE